jgi:hypothetical protein
MVSASGIACVKTVRMADTLGVRQGINQATNPILPAALQFANLPAHRINAIFSRRRTEHIRDFVGRQSGAIH